MPKKKPTHGGARKGAGRKPRLSPGAIRQSITIEAEHVAYLKATFGNVSAGVRALVASTSRR